MEYKEVFNQAELDAIPLDFDGIICIKFGTWFNRAVVRQRYKYPVEARENSSVVAWGNSSVEAWENSSVEARENSSVVAWGNSSVEAWGNSSVEAWGNSQIVSCSGGCKIEVSGNARIVYNPRTIQEYADFYGLENDGKKIRLFKAVQRYADGTLRSGWDGTFIYTVGEEAVADRLTTDPKEDCGHGIHMAYKEWALDFGRSWGKDLVILELEADMDGIIVPEYGPGKVRAAKATVIREVPVSECGLSGKFHAKRFGLE